MSDAASNLYNNLLQIYTDKFIELKPPKKNKIALKNRPESLSLEDYTYEGWFSENEDKESHDKKRRIS